jgi:hypothetical protein
MINWKGFGRKRSWPDFKVLFRHSPWGTEENTVNLSWDIRSPSRVLNPGPPKDEAGLFITRPRSSVDVIKEGPSWKLFRAIDIVKYCVFWYPVTIFLNIGRSRFDPRQRRKDFSSSSMSRPALRPTQPPVQWGTARPGRDADHSPPSSAEVINE